VAPSSVLQTRGETGRAARPVMEIAAVAIRLRCWTAAEVGRLDCLPGDRVILAHERARCLVVEGGALAAHLLLRLCQRAHRRTAPMTALLARGDPPLALHQRALGAAGVPGVSTGSPAAVRSNPFTPTAMPGSRPGSRPASGNGCTGTAAQAIALYQPSASWETVPVLGVPANGRDQWTALRPSVDKTREPFSRRAPLPSSLEGNESGARLAVEAGKAGILPGADAAEEGVRGRVHARQHVVQHTCSTRAAQVQGPPRTRGTRR
jgi:hypothetical protein